MRQRDLGGTIDLLGLFSAAENLWSDISHITNIYQLCYHSWY